MSNEKILWADDEIELLKAHILFLESKGYNVECVNNGVDAIELAQSEHFDIIFLDENMPGMSGLETLVKIKEYDNTVPIVMITKSEEEDLMNQAIGNKIADYLIKPVNPNQILLSIKKNINKKSFIQETSTDSYRTEFSNISMQINEAETINDWADVYKKLVYWEIELENSDNSMDEILKTQKKEANSTFVKYIKKNYEKWFEKGMQRPIMSHDIFEKYVFPKIDNGEKVFFVLFDNLRLDQWRTVKELFKDDFLIQEELLYCSILPTATQYARNSIFSGLLPTQIKSNYPQYWSDEDSEDSKNQYEKELVENLVKRTNRNCSISYHKINDLAASDKYMSSWQKEMNCQLNIVVFNFVDMLSHARTDSKMIRELANDDAGYRSLTKSWFIHSSIMDLFHFISNQNAKVFITTDHGTIKVSNPTKVIGDRETNTNLRYKVGKNLSYNSKDVFVLDKPNLVGLPSPNLSSKYIFACNDDFFAYPNNFGYYVQYYKSTFQHGGISMEEMMIPIIELSTKNK